MIHTKRYIKDGVGIYCGDSLVSLEFTKSANFALTPCRYCGRYVWTVGSCLEDDRVFESKKKKKPDYLGYFKSLLYKTEFIW